ncbi:MULTISPECIES: polysaccharide pyruvyl transferase family protein [Saccharopolyspora]|uniref:Polysaccharide pyruvyl transferase family protein n=1 Tax=Saccharopolyspora cebuensis TaxID=418759 RepID=A0ABV4CLD3_9PSEU
MRVLITGWPSFVRGEATAGDVRSMCRVAAGLSDHGIPLDVAWSPRFVPGGWDLDAARGTEYSHVVFACGPVAGDRIDALHEAFPRSRRIAVGVSVVDGGADGFHVVLPRDGGTAPPELDLATRPGRHDVPVVGVVLAPGQPEYGPRRRHDVVHERIGSWLGALDAAPVVLDSRLDTADWRHCSTADQFAALLGRVDVVLTSRLHGLVFALGEGVPALAVDPVAGGGKVTEQARAWDWPALVGAEQLVGDERGRALDRWWSWCRSETGRARARQRAAAAEDGSPLVAELVRELRARP